ncbi:hypothetical protein FD724_05575 [Nostoc sp. C057]|uniref:hypothetical protein n=1 Tax=Nostoc sp. C057 TaxID=2576903 RepID=UPI0015C2F139|nr:hypothetical protein [Nostoc sp. C057]QLE47636.1 hypothetical protein FD724_05575 [Nostoc sp. C057]
MQILTNFPSLIDRWLRYQFQTILVVCFLIWTPLLVVETLQIQHSCHPMIHWSGTLPAECQPKLLQFNSSSSKKPETRRDRSQEQKQIAKSDRSPSPKPSSTPQRQIPSISPPSQSPEREDVLKIAKEHPDITGGVIGIGVASLMAVIGGVPLAVAVGIGAVVWLAIKTVL